MTPAPTLQELIDTVQGDAPSADLLDLLATASSTVAQLEEVGDAVLGHFVESCRRGGHSWTEISTALGVSKQAAHKRFSFPAPTLEGRDRGELAAVRLPVPFELLADGLGPDPAGGDLDDR
jgi:hypothetical protein